jgi:hypothetical protein
MGFLVPAGVLLAALLIAEVSFVLYSVNPNPTMPATGIGLTSSIGSALFTTYLLPFEITSILLLMAIVGAMTLARRTGVFLSAEARVVPGAQSLAASDLDPSASHDDQKVVETSTTDEAARVLDITSRREPGGGE